MIKKIFVCDLCLSETPRDPSCALKYFEIKISPKFMTESTDSILAHHPFKRDVCKECMEHLDLVHDEVENDN